MSQLDISTYKYFLVIDLEATCCDKQSIPRHEMEMIEINAVMVEAQELKIVDEFSTFVRPVRNPVLTPFCTKLTSITQLDVDAAPFYKEAIQVFKDWLSQYESYLFCSWGDYDKHQFEHDCQLHKVAYPMDSAHLNIKVMFTESQGMVHNKGLAKALKITGLEPQGTHHRGIDDARNTARLMPFVLGRERVRK